jgi:GT2 family glycosyltransferase
MSYSVVILSRSTANLIPCVEAICRNEPDLPSSHIIVVDDDETGKVEEFCASADLTRIAGVKPFVFSRNANLGLAAAFLECNHVILLNDDALLSKRRGFAAMISAQRLAPEFGLVASSVNSVGNTNQHPKGAAFIRYEPRMLCFVCVLIPLSTWERVGTLDESYCIDYGCEDGDYSYRTRLAGLKLGIFDGCFVDHASLRSTYRSAGPASFQQNMRVFEKKFGMRYMSR